MALRSFRRADLKRTVKTRSLRDGLLGGSGFWLFIFIARFLGSRIQRVTKRGEKPIRFSESLAPGESIVISHIDPSASRR